MIADLKPYPAYRVVDGGWIGEIPSHWRVRRMKYVVHEIDSRSTTGKEQLLRISQYTGVTLRRRADGLEQPDTRADSLVGYKRVEPNDLVINIMLAWNGSMGVSRYEGIASPAYCVYRFARDLHPWYFHNLLRSPAYKARIKASSTGVVESRLRLYSDDLGRIEAMLPPPAEQAAIVRFLDWANGRLERAIRAKRQVIGLLNEQKQAIIHRAVTRGLDPSVPLKPSGIPWLGDIPQHWEVRALKRACERSSLYGANVPADRYVQSGVRFLRTTDIGEGGELRDKGVFISDDDARSYLMDDGDFLVSRSGTVGRGFVYSADVHGPCAYAGYLVRFVLRQRDLLPEFLWSFTKTPAFAEFLRSVAIASTIENVNGEKFGNMPCAFPSVSEQRSILARIAAETAHLKTAIFRLEREIDLLREYRTRLVADVVTGKVDVREAAARLPDEAPVEPVESDTVLGDEIATADEDAAV